MLDSWLCEDWETVLPDWVPEEAWNAWEAKRIKKKNPLSLYTRKQRLTDLCTFKMEGYDIKLILDRSENNNWAGLFRHGEPKQKHLHAPRSLSGTVQGLVKHTAIPKSNYAQKHAHANQVRQQGRKALDEMKRVLK